MPLTDPGIILAAGQGQQEIDPLGQALAKANAIQVFRQNQMQLAQQQQAMQKQNAILALYRQPLALDLKTGMPTSDTLAKINQIDPQAGEQITQRIASIESTNALREQRLSSAQMRWREEGTDALSDGIVAYDDAVSQGTDPQVARARLLGDLKTHLDEQKDMPEEQRNANYSRLSSLSIDGLRKLSLSQKQLVARDDIDIRAAEHKTPVIQHLPDGQTMQGFVDQAGRFYNSEGQIVPVTGTLEHIGTPFDPARAAAAVQNKVQVLHDPKTDTDYVYNPITHAATTLSGEPYTPRSASHLAGGQARSAAALAAQRYVEENPNATAEDIARFAGQYQATVTAGAGVAHAEASGLTNLTKMRDSVAQAEGNARKESQLVESLLDKGGLPGGPSAFGKWVQGTRTGVFNDPDASAFQTAVESLKNEYVKVLSTQGGMSGGMSSDAARREADQYINPRLSKGQIKANIGVMQRSMQNRTDAINEAIAAAQERLRSAGQGGGSDTHGGTIAHPTSREEYERLPAGAHYVKPGDPPGTFRVKRG